METTKNPQVSLKFVYDYDENLQFSVTVCHFRQLLCLEILLGFLIVLLASVSLETSLEDLPVRTPSKKAVVQGKRSVHKPFAPKRRPSALCSERDSVVSRCQIYAVFWSFSRCRYFADVSGKNGLICSV